MPTAETICAVLVGNATSETRATENAQAMQSCPYVALYTAAGRLVVGLFALPEKKRWWIEIPQDRPELLGLDEVAVLVTDRITAHSPWSRQEVEPLLNVAPCGSRCSECPQYHARCQGCPATTWYLETAG